MITSKTITRHGEAFSSAFRGYDNNRCRKAIGNADKYVKTKIGNTDKKRKVVLLALPAGIARASLFAATPIFMMADRVASAVRTTKNSEESVAKKVRKWVVLPLKLAGLAVLTAWSIAASPFAAILFTIRALSELRKMKTNTEQ